jgi:hypothetical protein
VQSSDATLGLKIHGRLSEDKCSFCLEGNFLKWHHKVCSCEKFGLIGLIHSGFWGPFKVSNSSNFKYFITFVDDLKICISQLSKNQRWSLQVFQGIKYQVETLSPGHKIQRFKCDNGKEYISEEMKDFLKESDISLDLTTS